MTYYRYVRHRERFDFEWNGWEFASDLGPTHGEWSVLMKFKGGGGSW